VIVGMFVAVWVLALAIWRFGRVESRWRHAAARAAGDNG
jgi:nickel/cobalt transporter (NiCoT) family protein